MPDPGDPQTRGTPWPSRVRTGSVVLIVLATLLVVLAPLRNIPVGIESIAHLEVFSADEPAMVYRVSRHLEERTLDPEGSFNYGSVYPTLAVGILELMRAGGADPTERRIALTLRLLSWFSWLGVLTLTFLLLLRFRVSLPASWLAVLLLASGTGIQYWAQHVHPDLLQSFLVLLAFWLVVRKQTWPFAWTACAICGFAFGTKYSGAFAGPFVLLPAVLTTWSTDRRMSRASRGLRIAGGLGLGLIGFLGGWLASNPYVLTSFPEFWADLMFERRHLDFGHYVPESRNPLRWLSLWARDARAGGSWLIVVGLLGAGRALLASGEQSRVPGLRDRLLIGTILAYIVVCSIHLGIEVNMRRMRYALHYWPLVFVLVGYGLDRTFGWVRSRNLSAAVAILFLAFASASWAGFETVRQQMPLARRGEDPAFAAAEWMVGRYKPETPILADVYAFRHPYFEDLTTILGVRPHDLVERTPFAIVLMERMSGRFSWKAPGTSFADHDYILGPGQNAESIQRFHHELFAATSPYQIAFESPTVVVLELKREVFEEGPAESGP